MIDAHAHIGHFVADHMSGDANVVRGLATSAGIDQTIISSLPAMAGELASGNAAVITAVEQHENLFGFIVLHPFFPVDSARLIERYGGHPKVVGFKLHPRIGRYELTYRAVGELIEMVQPLGLPVQSHTTGTQTPDVSVASRYSTIWMIKQLAEEFPSVNFIAAHMGISEHLQSGAEAVQGCRTNNLWLDTAAIELAHNGLLGVIVRRIGTSRIIFGSDSPVHHPGAFTHLLAASSLSSSAIEAVARDNLVAIVPRLAQAPANAEG